MSINNDSRKILEYGFALVSSGVGSILSTSTNDPIGQVIGSQFGQVLNIVLNDFASRKLSKREEYKVGGVTLEIIDRIKKNVNDNKHINKDMFGAIDEANWNSAAELYEAVLIKATNESREKKLKYVGNVFANCLFTEGMSFDDAHSMIEMLDNINYRKLCLLSLYGRKEKLLNGDSLMKDRYSLYEIQYDIGLISILQDLWELGQQNNLLNIGNLTPNFTLLEPDRYKLTEAGLAIYRLLNLDEIPESEIDAIIQKLKYNDDYGISSENTKNGVKVQTSD